MTQLLTDHEITERVLSHIEHGTTDVSDEVWHEPVANYTSEARFEAEMQMLRRSPVPFCPSAALPETGSYIAREAAGTPLLVTRDETGRVRAFKNVCRHRGMRVADGTGCARAFVCGYHGWIYGLDGSLKKVPGEDGFPGLDKATHGLAEVAAAERNGIVFVTQEGAMREDLLDDLPDLMGSEGGMFKTDTAEVAANWKIFMEGFIEGYHIRATHPESFLPYGFDNLNVIETFGRHSRVTYPFRRIKKLTDVPAEQRSVSGLVTFVYHIFPTALVTVLSSHTNLVILEPVDIGRTRSISYSMANAAGDEAMEAAKRDSEFVGSTGVSEDRAVVQAIQQGVASGANEVFTFGHFEGAIIHFHRTLDAALGA